jgi:hypothetical protein
MDATVPKQVRETVQSVAGIVIRRAKISAPVDTGIAAERGGNARAMDVAVRLKIDKSAPSRRRKRVADLGYICNEEQIEWSRREKHRPKSIARRRAPFCIILTK